jgi:hypothetical protein
MNDQPRSDCFCHGAGPRITQKTREFRTKTCAEHFRTAGVEFLKGIRTIVDLGIDHLAHEAETRGASINVE